MTVSIGGAERRTSPRVDEVQLVQVSEPGSLSRATGRTINLSRGGVRLEMGSQLPLRSTMASIRSCGSSLVMGMPATVEYRGSGTIASPQTPAPPPSVSNGNASRAGAPGRNADTTASCAPAAS